MKQYYAIKAKYPGALVLFRVGDFYETFGEDAIKTSSILGIVLTKRHNGAANEMELAGFPHHSLDSYLPKLVRAGQRVAICDQLEDPKAAKGIVKRGVTELVTPGVSYNDHVLEVKQNNYLASVYLKGDHPVLGIAFLDISTGEFFTTQGNAAYADKLLQGLMPSEVIFSKAHRGKFNEYFGDKLNTYATDDWVYQPDYASETLLNHFGTKSLKGFGIDSLHEGIIAAGAILYYLKETEHNEISHISSISRLEEDRFVWLDRFTIRNLELVYPSQEGGVPLVDILDQTLTPMGGRLLRRWLVMPLKEAVPIRERLAGVEALVSNSDLAETLQHYLKQVGDPERLISKVAARRIGPREMLQLKKSLQQVPAIQQAIRQSGYAALGKQADLLNPCEYLREKIEKELKDELPALSNQGNLFRDGINTELDELRSISWHGKDHLLRITQREIERTGISSLKIQYNRVFGYYLEVTNTHKDKVPADWIRKQTTVNAERYITEELKEYEEKILNAEDLLNAIESRLFQELVVQAGDYVHQIQQNARILAEIDCLLSFAALAGKQKYCKPEINETCVLNIKQGRHPVIEQQLPTGEVYVPNDIFLDDQQQQVMVITGPNMAGKSALLRQTALITLMAQIGSFVPAKSAEIGLVDKIFTRVGASDNLSRGESTFMVEMTETASILNNLSNRSLVLMDEIGRGTSTYDGISIAWAIVEHLHNHPKHRARTLFATHYHELNELAGSLSRVKNFNVSVKETGGKILFMRTLREGGSEHSFGIHVAQIAGMPNGVVIRANDIMHELEKEKLRDRQKERLKELPPSQYQLSMFEVNDPAYRKVKEMLAALDINTLSPVEALLKLNEIKGLIK